MQATLVALALVSGAGAFAPVSAPAATALTARSAEDFGGVKSMEGIQAPVGFFDPLGLSKTSPQALAWYRACEIKHGRVAMLACTGFIVQGSGNHFPGMLASSKYYPDNALFQSDISFADLGKEPLQAWAAIPDVGKWQIISTIFFLEMYQETRKPHYQRGGDIGKIPILWDPVGCLLRGAPVTDNLSEESKASKRNAELSNGRLAMIGAMGFSAAACLDGSVPLLPNGF